MQNLTLKQRQFVKLLRVGKLPVPKMIDAVQITPHRLARWMKNPSFRHEMDQAAKAIRLVSMWELIRITPAALRASLRLLGRKDQPVRVGVATAILKGLQDQSRDERLRKAKRPPRPMIVHPGHGAAAKEKLEALKRARESSPPYIVQRSIGARP